MSGKRFDFSNDLARTPWGQRRRSERLVVMAITWLWVGLSLATAQDAFVVPERYSIQRYARLLQKSPFAQAALLQEVASKDDFAASFVIVSHYRLSGVLYVNLLERSNQKRLTATTEDHPLSGLKVISLSESSNPWLVKVVVEREGKRGTIGFDPPKFPQPTAQTTSVSSNPQTALNSPVQRTRVRSPQDD